MHGSGRRRGPRARGQQGQRPREEGQPQTGRPPPRVARPAGSAGQIASQGAQIRLTLEFLLSRNQLISPLFKSIRDTYKWQSRSLSASTSRLALCPAITHLHPNPRQFTIRARVARL